MKCLTFDCEEYEFDDAEQLWMCPHCNDALSKRAYEKIKAMQAVIAKLPADHDGLPICPGDCVMVQGTRGAVEYRVWSFFYYHFPGTQPRWFAHVDGAQIELSTSYRKSESEAEHGAT